MNTRRYYNRTITAFICLTSFISRILVGLFLEWHMHECTERAYENLIKQLLSMEPAFFMEFGQLYKGTQYNTPKYEN